MSLGLRISCLRGGIFGWSEYTKFLIEPRNRGSYITLGRARRVNLELYLGTRKTEQVLNVNACWVAFEHDTDCIVSGIRADEGNSKEKKLAKKIMQNERKPPKKRRKKSFEFSRNWHIHAIGKWVAQTSFLSVGKLIKLPSSSAHRRVEPHHTFSGFSVFGGGSTGRIQSTFLVGSISIAPCLACVVCVPRKILHYRDTLAFTFCLPARRMPFQNRTKQNRIENTVPTSYFIPRLGTHFRFDD